MFGVGKPSDLEETTFINKNALAKSIFLFSVRNTKLPLHRPLGAAVQGKVTYAFTSLTDSVKSVTEKSDAVSE